MKPARNIPDAAHNAQLKAADPEVSIFVSANAGSGKTYVLARRVINLLLKGTDPAKILCITFTKAAAANMANEVFKLLARWTTLDDDALDIEIRTSTGRQPDAKQRARARRLFATALETPGGLKVQTIHAFCTRLLHQFPFEADVAARFTVLDDATTGQLLNRLTMDVLLEAAADPDGALGRALADAIVAAADQTFKEMITEMIGKRDALAGWLKRAGGLDQAIAELSRMLGVAPNETRQTIENEYFSGSLLPEADWPALMQALAKGSTSDQTHIAALEAARAATDRPRIDAYLQVFCTSELAPRKAILTKKSAESHPDWAARLQAEQGRVCNLLARERALACRDRTAALVTIANAVIARYRAEKDRRGLLDYDDLIDKTLNLFSKATAAWVLYKLDLGIDHVLVDEAQDTSPKQWQIIKTLVAEFIPGGARENVRRTIFAVGDEKQSIFSFQGAAPHAFAESRNHFRDLYAGSDISFAESKLEFSFRSAADVLRAVDTVFSQPEAYRGLTADAVKTVHQPLPDAAPGLVELWELTEPDVTPDIEGWDAPFDRRSETSPAIKLARRIARHVKLWCERGGSPRDVLVLVRARGPLFEAIIRALKAADIPVAGADRLVLTEHIAVMDLLVLADALLLPDDDLALATVLKSPLFGLNDDHLMQAAIGRKGPLRGALHTKAGDDPIFAAAAQTLDDLAQAARHMTPFAFYAHVLGAREGRKQFLARLGTEANDPLDEFLNLTLDYEARETPSLQGFVNWLRAAQSEIKRDMEMQRDEVRVMTVHGAKGLEAKTVILADTTSKPGGPREPRLLTLPSGNASPDDGALAWATASAKDIGPMVDARAAAKSAAQDESHRLLYVAMTRSAERLIVCGVKGKNKIPDGCWYTLIEQSIAPLSVKEYAEDGDGQVLRFYKVKPEPSGPMPQAEKAKAIKLPPWLRGDVAARRVVPRLITPSDSGEDDPYRSASSGDRNKALRRGTLLHRLMQSLPDIAPERRAAAARAYLGRDGDLSKAEHADMTEQVLRLLNDERFAPLFLPGSRAEVSIAGEVTLGGEIRTVAGQIDRLVVTADQVLIADYKTNRPAPQRIADVPFGYLRQLALYRAVLQKIYPKKIVRAALIWTEVPDLMELSSDVMDHALMPGHLGVTLP